MGFFDKFLPPTLPPTLESPAVASPANAVRAVTAGGEKINLKDQDAIANMRYRVYAEWQNDAWGYYDAIGEIKYGFGMVASVLSRVRLYSAFNLDPDSVPQSTLDYRRRLDKLSDDENAKDESQEMKAPSSITPEVMEYMEELVADLGTGPGGMSSFLRTFALNMSIPGECYLVEIDGEWTIKSSDEIVVDAGGQVLLRRQRVIGGANAHGGSVTSNGSTVGDRVLPKSTNIIRVWREHPRYSQEPESSMLGLREACDELLTLQRMIRAVARSNMNAGILFIPDTLRAAGSTVAEDVQREEELAEEFIASLYDNLVSPITDETNAASVVPTVITGPPEDGKFISYTEISRKVDQFLTERCDRALERVLQGIDMPKDFVTGLANVRYTNAKSIDESLYKSHIEPMVLMLVDALNVGYFKPQLRKRFPKSVLSDRDLRKLTIWYDPTEVISRADPAESANKGFENYALSMDAWRQANGYSDTDAPSEEEIALRMLQKAAIPPELVTSLFNTIFKSIIEKQRSQAMEKNPGGFPESAKQILYGDDGTDDAPNEGGSIPYEVEEKADPNAPEPGSLSDITADNEEEDDEEDDGLTAAVRSLTASALYNKPYVETDLQERYRIIAEAAVRSNDFVTKEFRIADLTPTQPQDRTNTAGSGAGAKDLPPIVIKYQGTDYLLDGHHRASSRNRKRIVAAYVDVGNLRTVVGKAV